MKRAPIGLAILLFLQLTSCKLLEPTETSSHVVVDLDTIEVVEEIDKRPVYHPSETRTIDLLHTSLDVRFDWENQYLNGIAELTFTAYFYPIQEVTLDAKGFDIHEVYSVGADTQPLQYIYQDDVLAIQLDSSLTRMDTLTIGIDYTAKPEERELGGSAAIMSDKGLYFINPLNTDTTKPQQIWTQGETEASSCWFPTVDAPNERMTQDIAITVQSKYKTLSNGKLIYSTENEDGTRTDFWEQTLPHAPYLVMMAVGDFAKIEDQWRDTLDVDYYVEPEYADAAQAIFGATPEMIEFYSTILDYPYPWEKYSQVIVRDYVSGAMENTTGVIFGEFVQKTKRELIDGNNEDIIAHELIHHWFGDLVTCESWANLPLNESFATYGEYLWNEYKHGRMYADAKLDTDLENYLSEFSRGKQVDMIRFNYDDKEDMFDAHSYQKGGRILHMLRKYVGDEAFYASLNKYLTDNAYTAVEIHDLRLAFEAVTGEDLNWFFNQWFLDNGHPDLHITYHYNDSLNIQEVTIEQKQDTDEFPVYKLPMAIDIYTSTGTERHRIELDSVKQTFEFNVKGKPFLVNVDAEKMLLCTKTDEKPMDWYFYQLEHAPLYLDKLEAMKAIENRVLSDQVAAKAIFSQFDSPSVKLRRRAIGNTMKLKKQIGEELASALVNKARTDESSAVRAGALDELAENYAAKKYAELAEVQIKKDSSYLVLGAALSLLTEADPKLARGYAKDLEKEDNNSLRTSISALYAEVGIDEDHGFFTQNLTRMGGFSQIAFSANYAEYLTQDRPVAVLNEATNAYESALSSTGGLWFINFSIARSFKKVQSHYQKKAAQLEKDLMKTEEMGDRDAVKQDELQRLKMALDNMSAASERIKNIEGLDRRVKGAL